MNISKMVKNLGGVISKNSPVLLTGTAVAGVLATTILAVKATPKALEIIKENTVLHHEVGEGVLLYKNPPIPTIIKLTWTCYIPAATTGVVTIACIIGANHISLRRNAALASLYSITETAFKEYQSKVVETIGQKKEQKVKDDISGEQIRNNPPGATEIIFTGKGDILCYDSLSGRYFKSNVEAINKAINQLNKDLMNDIFVSLNELYSKLGLADIKLGDELGWDIDKGFINITFSSQLTEENEPCLVINYTLSPRHI